MTARVFIGDMPFKNIFLGRMMQVNMEAADKHMLPL
jgi:hypothetical protein